MKKVVTMVIQAFVDDDLTPTETIKGLSEQISYNLNDTRVRVLHAKVQERYRKKMIDIDVD